MKLSKREPARDLRDLRRAMEETFEGFFEPRMEFLPAFGESLALDMYETEDAIKLEAQLPGLTADQVDLTVSGRTLTIKGEREERKEVEERDYYRREIAFGRFSRNVLLPDAADTEKATASFRDGVLTVTFPKVAEAKVRKIELHE